MKRAALIFLTFCFAMNVLAQRTRPRVVTAPTPAPVEEDRSTANDNVAVNDTGRRPPVLISRDAKPAPTPAPQPQSEIVEDEEEVLRVETNLVTTPVTVLDRDGRFVSGLQQRDFQILDNGAPQKIEYFASVETPFTVVLMIDVSPSTQYKIDEIHRAALSFVDQLRANDRVMVVSFDEKVHVLTDATNNRAIVRNAITQAEFGNGTSLYEAVDFVIQRQLRAIQGRKAVVLFTDGVDTTSKRASYESTLKNAEETDALFYPIRYDTSGSYGSGGGVSSGGGIMTQILIGIMTGGKVSGGRAPRGSSRNEYERGQQYLANLAQNSGGRKFETNTVGNLDSSFTSIAEELRRQYSIGYYPADTGTAGERRTIKVRVARPNLIVRAKNSYIVGANGK